MDSKIPATLAQKRLYLIDKIIDHPSVYHVSFCFRIEGNFSPKRFKNAFTEIIKKHPSLRTSFHKSEEDIKQILHKKPRLDFQILNTCEDAEKIIRDNIETPFNLGKGPLHRIRIISSPPSHQLLSITLHHIICDAWSMELILKDLQKSYQQETFSKEEIESQYINYCANESSKDHSHSLNYWKKKLEGINSNLNLPYINEVPPKKYSHKGRRIHFKILPQLKKDLKKLSESYGGTLSMTCLAAFHLLLFRYSCQNDIPIGLSIANRFSEKSMSLVGFFVNTIVLREVIKVENSIEHHLKKIRNCCLDAYDHCECPFDEVAQQSASKGQNATFSPLFQVFFNYLSENSLNFSLPHTITEQQNLPIHTSKFELSLEVFEKENTLEGHLEYCSELFDEKVIKNMAQHFQILLQNITKNPKQKIKNLEMLTESEKKELLASYY